MSKLMIINCNNIIFHSKTYLITLNFYINYKLMITQKNMEYISGLKYKIPFKNIFNNFLYYK